MINMTTEQKKETQILKMTIKIMERYKVLNANLATKVAIQLFDYNIHLDKFQDKYYKGSFNLDEIVIYLIKKQIRKEKTVIFEEEKSKKKFISKIEPEKNEELQSNNKEKIITYKAKIKRITYPRDFKYYYEETS